MQKEVIDYTDQTLFEDNGFALSPVEKDFYTPEEAYELVVSEVKSIYEIKDAI